MKLYDADISSASSRVRIALAYKGLQAERLPIGIVGPDADNRDAAYLDVNPQGLVPALLTDGGTLLTQSLAIIEYLDELQPQPPLLPAGLEQRAKVRALALAVAAEIHPLLTPRIAARIKSQPGGGDVLLADWRRHWMEQGMDALEGMLARERSGRFSVGDAPTLADVLLYPQAINTERAGLDLARWPVLASIVDQLRAIPAFADNAPARLR